MVPAIRHNKALESRSSLKITQTLIRSKALELTKCATFNERRWAFSNQSASLPRGDLSQRDFIVRMHRSVNQCPVSRRMQTQSKSTLDEGWPLLNRLNSAALSGKCASESGSALHTNVPCMENAKMEIYELSIGCR